MVLRLRGLVARRNAFHQRLGFLLHHIEHKKMLYSAIRGLNHLRYQKELKVNNRFGDDRSTNLLKLDSFARFTVASVLILLTSLTATTTFALSEESKETDVNSGVIEQSLSQKSQKKQESFVDGSQFYIPPAEGSNMKVFSGNGNWYLVCNLVNRKDFYSLLI